MPLSRDELGPKRTWGREGGAGERSGSSLRIIHVMEGLGGSFVRILRVQEALGVSFVRILCVQEAPGGSRF